MAEDGITYLDANGDELLDDNGDVVLRDDGVQPCCCPVNACTTPDTICPCNIIGAGSGTVICCQNVEGTITITWPTITAASGIAGELYGAVVQDFIDTASGSAMVLDGPGLSGNFGGDVTGSPLWQMVYSKTGHVAQVDCCDSFTWRVKLTRQLSYPDVVYHLSVVVIKTDNGGRVAVGDPFPCGSKDWTEVLTVASTSTAADGDCCGPTENLAVDNIDADYIDDASLSVSSGQYSDNCSPCNWDALPDDLFIDLRQFYAPIPAGIATMTFSKVPANIIEPVGVTGSAPFEGSSGGFVTDGNYRVDWSGGLSVSRLDSGDCPDTCCWAMSNVSVQVQFFDGSSWNTVYFVAGYQARLCNRESITGTYDRTGASGPLTLDVTS